MSQATHRRSACGCTWDRRPGYGDIVIVQCIKHAAASRSPLARRAKRLADRLADALVHRLSGKRPRDPGPKGAA